MSNAPTYLSASRLFSPHSAVLAQNLLEPGFAVVGSRVVLLASHPYLKTQISHRQLFNVLMSCALLVNLELHFIDLLDMVDRHQVLLLDRSSLCYRGTGFTSRRMKQTLEDGSLLLAEFLFNGEKGVVVVVLRVVAVLVFRAGTLVDLVIYEICGNGGFLLLIERMGK